jgi:hypothetical protein
VRIDKVRDYKQILSRRAKELGGNQGDVMRL